MQVNDKTLDWRREWVVRSEARNEPDDCAVWDARAEDYAKRTDMSSYAREFIDGLDLTGGATVFDMGSGTGTLAISLAHMGHRVVCGDFSSGMRSALKMKAEEAGVLDMLSIHELSWEDDWRAAGILPKSVDIAVASRSVMVRDLGTALEKLEGVARRQVAITVSTRFGPRGEREVGETLYGLPYLPDFVYAMNMLFDMGRSPKLSYIDTLRGMENGGKRLVSWAFIRWEVE